MTPARAAAARRAATSSGSRRSSSPSRTTTASAAGSRAPTSSLVGVSRTSKTPLSIYLGYLGLEGDERAAREGDRAAEASCSRSTAAKIVGLTIDAQRLAEIRSERIALMGGDRRYANLNEIYEDLEHAAAIHRRLGCPVIDVSELSIEEIALRIVARRSSGAPAGGKRPVKPKPPVPRLALGALVRAARRRARRLLRALHAVLVRASVARLARRVPRRAGPSRAP